MLEKTYNCLNYRSQLKSILDRHRDSLRVEHLHEFEEYLRDNLNIKKLKLYRYSNADYFNLRNFETGKLRLTNNGILNDVFEGLPQGIDDSQIPYFSDLVYIKCFSESYKNILMWAHYADCNKGFCVEYDIGLIHNEDILKHLFPVIYGDTRAFRLDASEITKIVDDQKNLNFDIGQEGIGDYDNLCEKLLLFLFKGGDWSYEEEWRIIYTKAELYLCNDAFKQTIDFDYATGIYLGYRIDPEIKRNIKEIVERINEKRRKKNQEQITIYQAKLSEEKYELIFEKT